MTQFLYGAVDPVGAAYYAARCTPHEKIYKENIYESTKKKSIKNTRL